MGSKSIGKIGNTAAGRYSVHLHFSVCYITKHMGKESTDITKIGVE
jgi:hypothetical protein